MKRFIIASVLLIVLAASIIFVLYHSTKSLELAGTGIGQVGPSYVDISLDACNPSVVPLTVQDIEANLHGSSGDYGSLAIGGASISPLSEEMLQGKLDFTDFNSMKTVVNWILNNENNTDFNATLVVKTKIMGIIPYSYEKNYDLAEFSNMLLGNNLNSCTQKQNQSNDIKQQLSLVQARISATELIYSGKVGLGNGTQNNGINSTDYGSSG